MSHPVGSPDASASRLPEILASRAAATPDALALRFLADGESATRELTWSDLHAGASGIAAALVERRLAGQPVLITAAPGPGFVQALFGTWLAGAIAVPCHPPRGSRHRQRLEAIRHDSRATLALGEPPPRPLDGLDFLDPATLATRTAELSPPPTHRGPCLLQYTSGSTASPKGVALDHAALAAQLDLIHAHLAPLELRSLLSWLPPYHDMGLVLKILHSVHSGIPLTGFAPDLFVQRPARWLQAIARYQADFSGGPNFAFEWCLRAVTDEAIQRLDLSSWRCAPVGAERVRAETLRRFAERFAPCGFDPRAFCPGYGLAEATLVVTSRPPLADERWRLSEKDDSQVSCGPPLGDTQVRIVDPDTHCELPAGETGEIEVRSPSLARGYHHREAESTTTFVDGWLRTGDLGFLEKGELYIVGRLKDLIILDGVNHSPEDLEAAAFDAEPRLAAAAAIALDTPAGEAAALAIEIRDLDDEDPARLCARLRSAVARTAGISLHRIVLVRAGLLPRTTSGKVRRHAVREALAGGSLPLEFDDRDATPSPRPDRREPLEVLLEAIHQATGRQGARPTDDLASFGISSMEATRIAARIRQATGVQLEHADLFDAADFGALAAEIDRRQPASPLTIEPGSGLPSGRVSHSQERMAFLHRLDPQSAAYHVFGALDLEGPLDRPALEEAYRHLLDTHAILRSRHGESGMTLATDPPPPLETLKGDPDTTLQDFARRPFDLAHESPVRAALLSLAPDHHRLALCAHHIVADGWSARILVRQLATNYDAYRRNEAPPTAPSGPDFIDYAAWQRKRLDAGAADPQIDYWRDHLAGHPGKLELATDFPRPPKASSHGGAVMLDLPAELETAIDRLAREHRVTPFMVRFAAWCLLLRAHGAGDDLVSAVPVANRHHALAGEFVGTLVNTLPLRLTLRGNESFTDLLGRVRQAALGMQANQEAPFEKIIEAVRPERARDRAPIAQVMFDHQELHLPERWSGGLAVRPHLLHRGAVQFDLAMVGFRLPGLTRLILEFRADLFREATARAMLDRYLALLRAACEDPDATAVEIEALSETDHDLFEQVAHGPIRPHFPTRTTPALIAETVARQPQAIAFKSPHGSLDYAALDRRAAALAGALQARGVAPGDRVALLLDRTLDLPCALLAVWKCGAAYLPLDPANPPERLTLILDDQQPVRLLVSPGQRDRLPAGHEAIELDAALFDHPPAEPHDPAPTDPAYILYTSGSTGRPKGVVIPHAALANFLLSMAETPGFRAGETLLALTTISFDISGLELFLPLVVGGTVDLVPAETARDPAALRRHFEKTDPDVMQATPATWRMLLEAGWRGSRKLRILCGGEALDLPLARALRPLSAELWNLYGPTETTIWSTAWPVPAEPDAIRIGRPVANTPLRILGPGDRPIPPGVPGELLIGGAGLATGYWRRDALTAERFIHLHGERFYRTGDLARWHPDGSLECLGRTDSQVKVRGFRIELGEIDAALLSHPAVEEAATVLAGDRLVGWFRAPGLDPAALTTHLTEHLPDYMVPAPLVPLDRFPLTSSGKIDRPALAARPLPQVERPPEPLAADPLVHELTAIWAEILELPRVAPDDDFFALGGHSLLAARLATAAGQRTGLPIPLDWLFDRPTPAGMAERLHADPDIDLSLPRAIPLARGRGGTPLFWIHTLVDGGMGLLPYRDTARLLADVTDSYGIAEGTRTFDSLADLAAAQVECLRRIQPEGPYRLAGFCFGGNVAAEIAAQLHDAGETIELLALLEASPPHASDHRRWWLRAENWRSILHRLPARLRKLFHRDLHTVARRLRIKQRAAASQVEQLVRRDHSVPDLRGVLDLSLLDPPSRQRALRHWEALHHHTPRLPPAGRLVLIRALDEGWLPRDLQLGWQAPVPFETYSVSGRHEDFLRHHSAREIATILRGILPSTPP